MYLALKKKAHVVFLPSFQPVHDEELKREFEAANSYRRTAFEDEFVRYAESMLTEVDKRIRKGKQRLSLSVKDALVSTRIKVVVSVLNFSLNSHYSTPFICIVWLSF